jgi:hypothetical protein
MYFVFAEAGDELAFVFDEVLHLGSEGDVGKEESAVLVVVSVFLVGVTG